MWDNRIQSEMGCRESLEDVAAKLKKKIDIKTALYQPLVKFIDNYGYDFEGTERKTLFAIVGGLSMEIPKLEAEYQALLTKIEAGEK